MAFIIKKQDLNKEHQETSKAFTHEAGFTITFRSLSTPAFGRAYEIINKYANKEVALTATALNSISADSLSENEAVGYAIAQHLIVDWDLATEEDGKLEVSGENFAMLAGQLDNPMAFLYWCFDCARQVAQEVTNKYETIKKKPSKGGSGNKRTAT